MQALCRVEILYHGQLGKIGRCRLRHALHVGLDLTQLCLAAVEEVLREGPQDDVAHHERHAHDRCQVGPHGEHAGAKGAGGGVGAC